MPACIKHRLLCRLLCSKSGKTAKLDAPLGEIPLHMLGGKVRT